MFPSLTFGKQIAIGYAIALLFILVVGSIAVYNTNQLVAISRRMAASHQVKAAISEFQVAVMNADTSQRSYLIAGDSRFLERYKHATGEIQGIFLSLQGLTGDNPRHQARLTRAWPLVEARMSHRANMMAAHQKGGLQAVQRLVASQRDLQSKDKVWEILGEMAAEEGGLLERRAQEAQATASATLNTTLATTALALLASALVGMLITRSLTRRVGAGVHGLRSSSFELQAVANQQAAAAGQQATSMNEIAATMREVIASSRQIATGAQSVAHVAGETADAARAGERSVASAREALAAIQRHVETIVAHMLALGQKSQQIGAIVDITKELADQTNIVAINATIEAAGAGEQGRRFAAVADELRKLADRVADSTKQIRPLIDDVRAAADTTIMATEGGSKAVETGTRQFHELATAFGQIVRQVAITDAAAREIELSTHQQATAVEQVHLAIGDAARAARETEASSQQTLQTATQLSGLSRELSALTQAGAARE